MTNVISDNKEKRVAWVDVCRIIAAWGVICIHTRGNEYYTLLKWSKQWKIVLLYGHIFHVVCSDFPDAQWYVSAQRKEM